MRHISAILRDMGADEMTQNEKILEWLRTAPQATLTAKGAVAAWDCWRLSARIAELRAKGHDIKTEMVKGRRGVRYARYRLVK